MYGTSVVELKACKQPTGDQTLNYFLWRTHVFFSFFTGLEQENAVAAGHHVPAMS